jgi:MFS family permease
MWGLAGPLAAWLVARNGDRRVVVTGVALNVCACLLLTRIDVGTPQVEIVALLAFAGLGVGIIVPPLMAMLTTAVVPEDLGVATATSQMMVQIGSAAGVQLMQSVQVSRLASSGLAGSYHWAFVVGAVASVVGLASAAKVRRREVSPSELAPVR